MLRTFPPLSVLAVSRSGRVVKKMVLVNPPPDMRKTSMQQNLLSGNRRRVYRVGEVSEVLQVSTKTVYRLVARGLLKKSDALRHLRISAESVDQFIKC